MRTVFSLVLVSLLSNVSLAANKKIDIKLERFENTFVLDLVEGKHLTDLELASQFNCNEKQVNELLAKLSRISSGIKSSNARVQSLSTHLDVAFGITWFIQRQLSVKEKCSSCIYQVAYLNQARLVHPRVQASAHFSTSAGRLNKMKSYRYRQIMANFIEKKKLAEKSLNALDKMHMLPSKYRTLKKDLKNILRAEKRLMKEVIAAYERQLILLQEEAQFIYAP